MVARINTSKNILKALNYNEQKVVNGKAVIVRAFDYWQLTSIISDRLLKNIAHTRLFQSFNNSKLIALGFLIISLIEATRKRKNRKTISERFGKIMQDRSSVSINRGDTSISRSKQLDSAIPPSTIATLSSDEFVRMVADDDTNSKIDLKSFHCRILNDHQALKKEQKNYKAIPVIRRVHYGMIQRNCLSIKHEAKGLVEAKMGMLMDDAQMSRLIIKKECH